MLVQKDFGKRPQCFFIKFHGTGICSQPCLQPKRQQNVARSYPTSRSIFLLSPLQAASAAAPIGTAASIRLLYPLMPFSKPRLLLVLSLVLAFMTAAWAQSSFSIEEILFAFPQRACGREPRQPCRVGLRCKGGPQRVGRGRPGLQSHCPSGNPVQCGRRPADREPATDARRKDTGLCGGQLTEA